MNDKASTDILRKHLKCPLCSQQLKISRVLPCMHTFCEDCLQGYISSENLILERSFLSFKCPLCKSETQPFRIHEETDKWAEQYPSCDLINLLLSNTTSPDQQNSEKAKVKFCNHCREESIDKAAFGFCIVCVDYLCKECYESHRKFKVTRTHMVLKDSDLPEDESLLENMTKLRFCDQHFENEKEFKCLDHKSLFCSICAVSDHHSCKDIQDLDKICHDNDIIIQELRGKLQLIKNSLEDFLTAELIKFEEIENTAQRQNKLTVELIDDLQDVSFNLENNVLDKLKEKTVANTALINNCIQVCTKFSDITNRYLELAELVSKYNLKTHSLILDDSIAQNLIKITNFLTETTNKEFNFNEFFKEEMHELPSMFMHNILDKIGSFSTSTKPAPLLSANRPEQRSSVRTFNLDTNESVSKVEATGDPISVQTESAGCKATSSMKTRSRRPLFVCTARATNEFDLSVACFSKKMCSHSRSLVLENGNMIFVDKNNKLLKYVASEFKVKGYVNIKEEPKDVAFISENLVVATSTEILMYAIDKVYAFNPLKTCKTNADLVSVSSIDNNLALLYSRSMECNAEDFIQVRNKNGSIIRHIDCLRNKFGQRFTLRKPQLLRVRDKSKYIICEQKAVKCFNAFGMLQWYFINPGCWFKKVCCIAFDEENNMYICDFGADIIYQMAADNPFRSRIIVSNIKNPLSVLFCERSHCLVVGCEDDNKVHVYQLS